jgi:hypothetical protein
MSCLDPGSHSLPLLHPSGRQTTHAWMTHRYVLLLPQLCCCDSCLQCGRVAGTAQHLTVPLSYVQPPGWLVALKCSTCTEWQGLDVADSDGEEEVFLGCVWSGWEKGWGRKGVEGSANGKAGMCLTHLVCPYGVWGVAAGVCCQLGAQVAGCSTHTRTTRWVVNTGIP